MTLFARILVWFVALVGVLTAGFVVQDTLDDFPPERTGRLFVPPARILLDTVGMVHADSGADGVRDYLERIRRDLGVVVIATDWEGRDLVDGADRSELLSGGARFVTDGAGSYRTASDDQGIRVFIEASPQPDLPSFWVRRFWIFAVVTGLCYVLARHLTSPLERLRDTVEHFGSGDLAARVRSPRRDEVGQLGRAFNGMADRIQSLLANERTLLGDISHELRSPLTRLGLAVELGRSGGDQEEAYARIDREAGRLNTLVGELLRLSQSDSPDFAPRKDLVRLDQMVEELAEVMELEASEKGCRIEVRASRIEVRANGEALRRAVENVLSNSIRFSPPSELIDVRIDRGAGGIRIRVRDRGPGVPPEALDRIFETFYRVDSDRNRDTGGVGLGLAIVARAISAHGGRATARNVNPGLEVEIWLPPEPAAARDVNPEARQSARPPLRPRASPNP